jgi:5-methylcytosine-specific restriction protein A
MLKITHPSGIKITHFFEETLGVKLKNPQWSYGAMDPAKNRVFLKIWVSEQKEDDLGVKFEVYWKEGWKSNGKTERLKHLDAIRSGAECFGVLGEFLDPKAKRVKIKTFDDEQLLLLGNLSDDESYTYARVLRRFPIGELQALVNERVGFQNSAIDDIPSAPIGSEVPGRTPTAGSRYQRIESVRQFVIEKAKGTCEYCRKLGFPLPDGSRYLEAHHIIALAKQGPDTVDNVIALCPSDHREAHYGANREKLETEMKEIIKKRNPPRRSGHKSAE